MPASPRYREVGLRPLGFDQYRGRRRCRLPAPRKRRLSPLQAAPPAQAPLPHPDGLPSQPPLPLPSGRTPDRAARIGACSGHYTQPAALPDVLTAKAVRIGACSGRKGVWVAPRGAVAAQVVRIGACSGLGGAKTATQNLITSKAPRIGACSGRKAHGSFIVGVQTRRIQAY